MLFGQKAEAEEWKCAASDTTGGRFMSGRAQQLIEEQSQWNVGLGDIQEWKLVDRGVADDDYIVFATRSRWVPPGMVFGLNPEAHARMIERQLAYQRSRAIGAFANQVSI